MKRIYTLLLLLALCIGTFAAKKNEVVNITVNNEVRRYRLYVPNNVKSSAPLVFALHGTGGTCENPQPNMNSIADQKGCIVVYPQGETFYFPVFGGSVPGWHSTGEYTKDIDFIKAIIEDVNGKYPINRKRIYCCGFSNGGMMTYTVANQCGDIFAAFAAISGYPINEFHLHHTGYRPVPFLHIHGKADDFVRYALYPIIRSNMIARTGANPVPTVKTVSGKYTKSTYEATEGGFPYISYEVDGMGHNDWTANTEDGNSATTIWNFLYKYTLDSECDTTLKWRPNIEAPDFNAKSVGWTLYQGRTLAQFGGTQKTDANQNVYYSLQLEKGKYWFSFTTEGEADKTVAVRLQKLTGKKNNVLKDTVSVADHTHRLYFEVTDGWGEYKLTMTRSANTDNIKLSQIEIHSLTADEETAIKDVAKDHPLVYRPEAYDLSGRLARHDSKGLVVRRGRVERR